MKKSIKILIYVVIALLFVFVALFFLIPNRCEKDFKIYPEKGYCEFNLKTCEFLFGCKEYNNVQVPCGSVSTLCGEKVLCDCGDLSNDEIKEIENNKGAYNLPASFKADFISFQDYSLEIVEIESYDSINFKVINGEIECEEISPELSLSFRISRRELNGRKYCISASSEGAAGSVYTEYTYATVAGGEVYLIKFVVRYNNCGNYPEGEKLKCELERENFDLDILVDQEIKENIINN